MCALCSNIDYKIKFRTLTCNIDFFKEKSKINFSLWISSIQLNCQPPHEKCKYWVNLLTVLLLGVPWTFIQALGQNSHPSPMALKVPLNKFITIFWWNSSSLCLLQTVKGLLLFTQANGMFLHLLTRMTG